MKLPSDYTKAKGYTGAEVVNPLSLGGHICRIRGARIEKTRSGKDMLVVAFDIAEGSEWDGYYADRFSGLRNYNPDAKWPGRFSTTVTNNNGTTNGFFKGLIESVEKSNPGFDFVASGADENKLNGKLVGFNFGEEEYWSQVYNEVRTIIKPRYAVSVQDVKDGVEPPKLKKLDPSKIPQPVEAQSSSTIESDMDDDLPFELCARKEVMEWKSGAIYRGMSTYIRLQILAAYALAMARQQYALTGNAGYGVNGY